MGIWNALGSLLGSFQQNRNVDKQLNAQERENQKNREYNLNLAKLQNEWNIQQWRNENAYNSPAAQMERMRQAGLNLDMMYGGGVSGNLSAPSPILTSGAPSSPMDWSALGSKKTVGSAISDSLNTEMMRAKIDAIKADTRKTLADAGLSEISLEYADFEKRIGLKISEQQYENIKKDYELAVQAIDKNRAELEGITQDNAYKAIRNAFESEVFQTQIKILSEELNIKRIEAQHFYEYYTAQILGMQADNAWKDAAWIVQQKGGTATAIKYGSQVVGDLLGKLADFIPSKKGGKSITINNNIP